MSEHRHHHRQESRLRQFLSAYRFEVLWLFVVFLGVFLVLEQMDVRATLLRWLKAAEQPAMRGITRIGRAVLLFIERTTVADAIGYVLILGAFAAILLRFRWRLMRAPSLTTTRCPKCNVAIQRTHRRALDHALSWFVPVRRYRCSNHECGWRGLRVVSMTSRGGPVQTPGSTAPE
jgi:hypothetical protein